MRTTWLLFKVTVLSALVFLSISFITVLADINPLHIYGKNKPYYLGIGFPFEYYNQFWLSGSTIPNSGWNLDHLLLDFLLTWVTVAGLYFFASEKFGTKIRLRQNHAAGANKHK